MAKAKNPKSQKTHEPTTKEAELNKDAPRKYRLFKKQQEIFEKQQERKLQKSLVSKKKQNVASKPLNEQLQEIQAKVNRAEFKKTKKYQKRLKFLNRHKEEKLQEETRVKSRGEILEKTLTDKVKFGEVVNEPPKITALPKAKVYLPTPKPKTTQKEYNHVRGVGLKEVGRKVKLKDMPAVDRVELLKERQRVIDLYRKNQNK